jgi:hypothetical protein
MYIKLIIIYRVSWSFYIIGHCFSLHYFDYVHIIQYTSMRNYDYIIPVTALYYNYVRHHVIVFLQVLSTPIWSLAEARQEARPLIIRSTGT